MAAIEAVMLGYLISSRPSKCVNFFGQTVHTIQHIGYVTAQILTGSDINAQILTVANSLYKYWQLLTSLRKYWQLTKTISKSLKTCATTKPNSKSCQNVRNNETSMHNDASNFKIYQSLGRFHVHVTTIHAQCIDQTRFKTTTAHFHPTQNSNQQKQPPLHANKGSNPFSQNFPFHG